MSPEFSDMLETFRELGDALKSRFDQLGNAVAAVGQALGVAATQAVQFGTAAASTAKTLLALPLAPFTAAVSTATQTLVALARNPANPLGPLAAGFKQAAAPTAAQAGGLASGISGITDAVMGPLKQLTGVVGPFVQALNPALMRLFNQAMRDLMATFGVAFAPVIQHVTALFNELSATLLPAMQALTPIIDNLMSVLEGILVPEIGIIADAFVALSPVIEFVTRIMASVVEAMRVFYTVLRSAFDTIYKVVAGLFGGVDLKGAAQGIRDVIQRLTLYFVQFAAYIAKALGYLDPFAAALKRNLADLEGKKPGIKAAPENVHISGLEQIGKDLAVAAFSAGQAGGKVKSEEAKFLEELVKAVGEVEKNGKTLQEFLDAKLDELARVLHFTSWDEFKQWVAIQLQDLARQAGRAGELAEAGGRAALRGGALGPAGMIADWWLQRR
ncbi:MAG TPA: hypothetical protein VH575_14430 [Gemmataceae bacterium]|jgi:ABC-type transporter Mla subunit MlaD